MKKQEEKNNTFHGAKVARGECVTVANTVGTCMSNGGVQSMAGAVQGV